MQKVGDFEIGWSIATNQGYGREPSCEAVIRTPLGRTHRISLYCLRKRRKNSLGDRELYRLYDLSSYNLKKTLGDGDWVLLNNQIIEHKKVLKKKWDQENKIRNKKAMEEALKDGYSKEDYKKQKALLRKEARKTKSIGESVERTKRIILLAPLLSELRDSIDVVLKQFNEGRGDVGYHKNKADKLRDMIRVMNSFKS